ncbi:5-dehydro-2-deoxygluconokinase [Rhodobacteraceae bacterium]|nr:5-dehydro-2-deoxygluconokinase [Paracoccaceae bacterium]
MLPKDIDVITIGRSSIDLYGTEIGVSLADASLFRSSVGGSPTNIAAGASRLGLQAALLTRVGADQMGDAILQTLNQEGVDTSAIKTDADRLTALVLLTVQDRNNSPHVFYRRDCADMALCETDVSELFIARAKSIVVTGTHFSTPKVAAASWKAIRLAQVSGAKIIFDIDFRPSLWGLVSHSDGAERAGVAPVVRDAFLAVVDVADVIVGTEEEISAAAGLPDTAASLAKIRARTGAIIVCKRGAYGCDVYGGGNAGDLEAPVQGRKFEIEVINTIGAGDAFMAGFLRGYLRNEPLETCATIANACGAVAVTRLLCSQDYAYWGELQTFINRAENGATGQALIEGIRIKVPKDTGDIFFLACDHRTQFRDIADRLGKGYSRFPAFKRLAVQAVEQVRLTHANVGYIVDAEYGTDALFDAGRLGIRTARSLEVPKTRPIEFVTGKDVGSALNTWPQNQIVKCLCHYDPNDDAAILQTQQDRITQAFDACQRTGHDFLLEIVPPEIDGDREAAVIKAMGQFYGLGVKPDYWKLEPFSDPSTWAAITNVITQNDPQCRGVMVLGMESTPSEVSGALNAAATSPRVIGFAIGRAIVGAPFEAWLGDSIDDQTAVTQMVDNFSRFIDVWQQNRPQED